MLRFVEQLVCETQPRQRILRGSGVGVSEMPISDINGRNVNFGHPLAENGSSAVRRHLTRKCHNWPSKAENGSQRSISNSADRPTERLISSWLIFFVHRSISLLFEFGCSETPPIDQTTRIWLFRDTSHRPNDAVGERTVSWALAILRWLSPNGRAPLDSLSLYRGLAALYSGDSAVAVTERPGTT